MWILNEGGMWSFLYIIVDVNYGNFFKRLEGGKIKFYRFSVLFYLFILCFLISFDVMLYIIFF